MEWRINPSRINFQAKPYSPLLKEKNKFRTNTKITKSAMG